MVSPVPSKVRLALSSYMAHRAHGGVLIERVRRVAHRDCPTGKSVRPFDPACLALFSKIFPFAADPNQIYIVSRPVPEEGRLAIVTDAGRDAVDADGAFDEWRVKRTAKSCGPDTPTLVSSLR
jgi:hypothetical protein